MVSRITLPVSGWTPLPQVVARRLQQMILDGDLKPGDLIPSQRVLSQQFDVSRASLREALLDPRNAGADQDRTGARNFRRCRASHRNRVRH